MRKLEIKIRSKKPDLWLAWPANDFPSKSCIVMKDVCKVKVTQRVIEESKGLTSDYYIVHACYDITEDVWQTIGINAA